MKQETRPWPAFQTMAIAKGNFKFERSFRRTSVNGTFDRNQEDENQNEQKGNK